MFANLWNEDEAEKLAAEAGSEAADRDLARQVYASRLIGSDRALVQHGGGNTSCKVMRRDLFGCDIQVMHIKGSGRDLGDIDAAHMPGLRLDPLLELRGLDALCDADMLNVLRASMLDAAGPIPSVETLLHAYLPHAFIDHTHATVMLALANLPDPAAVVREIFGDRVATVPFFKPGFALGGAAADVFAANPDVEGLILINHGHFAFADAARAAYGLIITHTNMVAEWFRARRKSWPRSGGATPAAAKQQAAELLPVLRGIIGEQSARFCDNRDAPMPVMDLRAGPNVAEFLERGDLAALATRGVATPDHAIRTKNLPLHLTAATVSEGSPAIARAVEDYAAAYTDTFTRNAVRHDTGHDTPLGMLSPTPGMAWIEGLGVIGIGATAGAAAIAADMAEQNILAMTLSEDSGGFHPLAEADLFDMEYWALEQAKLDHAPAPAFAGRVVLVTGGAGAIGLATARAFADQGANVFLVDLHEDALARALAGLGAGHDGLALDITGAGAAARAVGACAARFGGLDILVSNAGAAWTGEMTALDDAVLRKSFELNFFAHQTFAKAAAQMFATQGRGKPGRGKSGRGGQILFNVSKQAVNPGKGFGAYGIPKAATFFLLRQLALELGPKGVRVNGINADRIRSGLLDDAFIRERAKARGVDEADYMAGNLIRREVEAHHVADAFVTLARAERTTAHVMTVDGGNIEAALR